MRLRVKVLHCEAMHTIYHHKARETSYSRAFGAVLRTLGLQLLENLAGFLRILLAVQSDVEDEACADHCT